MAKSFIYDLTTKECVDLDEYNYVLYEGLLRLVTIQNEYDDEDYSSIPLIVRVEED